MRPNKALSGMCPSQEGLNMTTMLNMEYKTFARIEQTLTELLYPAQNAFSSEFVYTQVHVVGFLFSRQGPPSVSSLADRDLSF